MMVSKKLNTTIEIDRPLTKNKISEDRVEMLLNPKAESPRYLPERQEYFEADPAPRCPEGRSAPRTVATNTTTPRYHPYQTRSREGRYVVQNTTERPPSKHDPCCIFECFIALLSVILIMFMIMAYSTITKEQYPIDYIFNVTNVTVTQ